MVRGQGNHWLPYRQFLLNNLIEYFIMICDIGENANLMTASGIELENPWPAQTWVGVRTSDGDTLWCMARVARYLAVS